MTRSFAAPSESASPNLRFWLSFDSTVGDAVYDGQNLIMPVVISDYIKRHIQFLDDKFLVLAADDIRRHLEDYAVHEMNPNLWQCLSDALETEQREHATRQARKSESCPVCERPLEVMSITNNQHSPGGVRCDCSLPELSHRL